MKCIACNFSSFPTEANGDLIENKKGIFEGKCSKWNKKIDANKSACSYSEESNGLIISTILNNHIDCIMKKIHESVKTISWNGKRWITTSKRFKY